MRSRSAACVADRLARRVAPRQHVGRVQRRRAVPCASRCASARLHDRLAGQLGARCRCAGRPGAVGNAGHQHRVVALAEHAHAGNYPDTSCPRRCGAVRRRFEQCVATRLRVLYRGPAARPGRGICQRHFVARRRPRDGLLRIRQPAEQLAELHALQPQRLAHARFPRESSCWRLRRPRRKSRTTSSPRRRELARRPASSGRSARRR